MSGRISRSRSRALVALALAAFALVLPRAALAWVETRVLGDDVRMTLGRDGKAKVEHRITLRISGGPLRGIDVPGIDADAEPLEGGYAVTARDAAAGSVASAVPLKVEVVKDEAPADAKEKKEKSPARLHLAFDHPKGLSRGTFVLVARYATDLAALGRILPGGAMTRVAWRGATFSDGLETPRLVVELPAAPTEPRADERGAGEGGDPGGGRQADEAHPPPFITSLRRGPERDVLELVRPYAPKGEPVLWAFLVDRRALDVAAPAPSGRPAPPPPPAALPLEDAGGRAAAVAGLSAIFLLFGAIVARKGREVDLAARARGAEAMPALPLPLTLRALLAGAALAGGVALQLSLKSGVPGALCVLLAAALAAHRAPKWPPGAGLRRPGRWLSLSEADAFSKPRAPAGPRSFLDPGRREGKAAFVLGLGLFAAGAAALAPRSPYHASLVALDAVALLAVFLTGREKELPPVRAEAASRLLARIARRLGADAKRKRGRIARVVPRVHVPEGSDEAPGEMRLVALPRRAAPGLVSVEIGVAFAAGAGGFVRTPELLVRYRQGSPCEARLADLASAPGAALPGRKPGELAVVLRPRLPSASGTASLVLSLLAWLEGAGAAPSPRAVVGSPGLASRAPVAA